MNDRPETASSRRAALKAGLGIACGAAMPAFDGVAAAAPASAPPCPTPPATAWPRGIEGQRRGDLGDGRFRNPVFSGDRPDPSILKDGADYYATFTTFVYYPGVVVWHSRDLVNWRPLGPALRTPIGSVFALDIARHDGRYFIYIPALVLPTPGSPPTGVAPFKTYVIHADSMSGPWSEPVDMDIDGYIDPGHAVGADGRRYLFLSDGHRVAISADGLRRAGPITKVYDGWKYPADWIVEGFALEGPKILRRGGWFYLFSGEGGTAGPPTSHMVVVARSRSIDGPWENCPHNPIVRTVSRDEPWWSRGHATAVEGPDGRWWLAYHGYENGFRTLGRQMLLEPFEWTDDGWPRATGGTLSHPLPKPVARAAGPHGVALSGPLDPAALGTRFAFYDPAAGYLERVRFADGAMTLAALGTGPADSSPLACIVGERGYRFDVTLTVRDGAEAGLLLFYDPKLFCGVGLSNGRLRTYKAGRMDTFTPGSAIAGTTVHLRVVNDADIVSFFYSLDGVRWTREVSYEVAGYNHNVGDGFLSLRPALYAAGTGSATFRDVAFAAG